MFRAKLHQLLQGRFWLLVLFAIIYLVLLFWRGWIILPLIGLELILRLLLRLTYGQQYRYSLYNYFLVDHPVYGNCFRPHANNRQLDFLICDKYVFRYGPVNPLNLAANRSGRVDFSINSRSFRGPEFAPRKAPGVFRIFCVGGSTTAGNWVNNDETWPAYLEQFLQPHGQRVEVINAGVQGWCSYQDLLRFQAEIVNYQPDLVIIKQGWNEEFIYSSQNLGRWWQPQVARHFMEEKYLFIPPNPILADTHSLLYFMLIRTYFKNFVFDKKMPFTNPKRWACLKQPDYLTAWFDNLVEFARIASTHDIPLRIINAPLLTDFADTKDERDFYLTQAKLPPLKADYLAVAQKRVEKTLKAINEFIPVINVAAPFRQLRGAARLPLFHDNIHPSASGNRRLAEIVSQALTPLKLQATKLPNKARLRELRQQVASNDTAIDKFIDRQISQLT